MYLKIIRNFFHSKNISIVVPKDTNNTKKPGTHFSLTADSLIENH